MQKFCRSLCLWALLGLAVICACRPSQSTPIALTPPAPTYQTLDWQQSRIHVLTIPATLPVRVVVAPQLATVAELATQSGAIAAINAGFFDPQNGLTTSHVMIAGQPAADPRQNPRLIENPNLTDYLPQILGRSELRIYLCRGIQRLAIAPHTDPVLAGCQLRDAVGAGPRLLPEITAEAEAFLGPGRDALGFNQPNARSAVGIKANGDLIWVMAAQIPGRSRGLSLPELAALLRHQGAEQGLNLDGGSSSSLYYQGHTHPGRVNAQGEPVSRAIKSALVLKEN